MLFYDYTLEMLENYFSQQGENKAKAKILFKAIYRNGLQLNGITELSEKTRKMIDGDFSFEPHTTFFLTSVLLNMFHFSMS